MNQKLIEGINIFPELISELEKAKSEILVASAWFTDFELFNTLVRKQKEGVNVKLIIADTEDNERIDFSLLKKAGGAVYKVKNKGFGMMHKKYCVIDYKLAIHGSYNWTLNAKKNNQESVIITDHMETVKELRNGFIKMEMEINGEANTPVKKPINLMGKIKGFFKRSDEDASNNAEVKKNSDNYTLVYQDVDNEFESIVSAEIKNIDREEIRSFGKESAKKVNGDEGILHNSMDSLFQIFISDINQVEEKKKALKAKIDSKTEEISSNYETDKDAKKHLKEEEYNIRMKGYNEQISSLEGKKKLKEGRIEYIKSTIIPDLNKKIESLRKEIANLQVEFVKPRIKYFELIPMLFILLGLGIALFLFYSSSAYIMLYAKEDALEALKNGIVPIAQVFNSHAIEYASYKGGTAVFYLSVFVFIPLAVAFVVHKSNIWGKMAGILSIVLMDIFVAYKVSDTIRNIRYLTDGTQINDPFYTDINFLLVFFLSAVPFVFFMILLNNTIAIFESRHPQVGKERVDFQVKQYVNNIKGIENQIEELQEEDHLLRINIIEIENEIDECKIKLADLALDLPKALNAIEDSYNNKVRALKRKADLYKNNIDNDNIPISISALKDRVSLFLEGWNEWLHEEFSVQKAKSYSDNARKAAEVWLSENISNDKNLYSLKKTAHNEKDFNIVSNGHSVSVLQ